MQSKIGTIYHTSLYSQQATIMAGMQSTEIKLKPAGRRFALCGSCYWCATVFHDGAVACPVCSKDVSLMPLALDEGYRVKVFRPGLELSFSRQA